MTERDKPVLLVAPEGFVVERDERAIEAADYRSGASREATLRISWPAGSRAGAMAMLAFCAVWFGFLGFWYTAAFHTGAPTFMFLFPLLHLGAGLAVLYRALVTLLNTTRLSLASGVLVVRSGPVPTRGNVRLEAGRIRQLFVTRQEHRGRRGATTSSFAVEAVLDAGSRQVIVRGLDEASAALYLEAVLEETLGIEPQPVLGEIAR